MTRYPPIAPQDMYYEQRRVVCAVAARRKPSVSSQGGVEGPFIPLVYSPGILDRLQNLGELCRFHTGLPAKLRELAIIITARHVGAQLEFHVHAMEAEEFGFSHEGIAAVAARQRPEKLDEDEALIYDFCTEMYAAGTVSDETFARAEKRFGRPVIVDLVATCGYYKTLGMVITTCHPPIPEFLKAGFVPAFDVETD